MPDIPNEGKFLAALGLNPAAVVAESTRIEWKGGNPVVTFTMIQEVPPEILGRALVASSEVEETGPQLVPDMDDKEDDDDSEGGPRAGDTARQAEPDGVQ